VSGFAVDSFGWETFYWITIACGLPGMLLLARFVPIGSRDLPEEDSNAAPPRSPLGTGALLCRGTGGAILTFAAGTLLAALLVMLAPSDDDATRTGLGPALLVVLRPEDVGGWLRLAGLATMAVCGGLLTAAGSAARRRAA
jgi:PAT family beta-lactamase induction signal transducer AmpG